MQEKLFLSKQLDKKVPQVSSKNFQSCAKEDQSFPSKNQEISKPNVRRQNSRKKANCPKSEITKDEAEREQSFSASPTPTMTGSYIQLFIYCLFFIKLNVILMLVVQIDLNL